MKNNKNFKNILVLFFIIVIYFIVYPNTTTAIYVYTNPNGNQTNVCGDTASACRINLSTRCPLSGINANSNVNCLFVNVLTTCDQNAETAVCPQIQAINPGASTTTAGSIYTPLAPLPGMTPDTTKDFPSYVNFIIKLVIGLCGALAVLMIVVGGIQYMGNESIFGQTEAKKQIFNAIAGLLIALGAWVLLNTINPDLLKLDMNVRSVSVVIETETVPWSIYQVGDNTSACPGGYVNVQTGGTMVNPINVCNTIADNLTKLLAAAKLAGINLAGSGSRSITYQQSLRVKNNCPDPKTPPSACTPNQVAVPGMSNHEKGLAIDFTCNGQTMEASGGINSPCYKWLANNAATYGLSNDYALIKESWHWSTTGN